MIVGVKEYDCFNNTNTCRTATLQSCWWPWIFIRSSNKNPRNSADNIRSRYANRVPLTGLDNMKRLIKLTIYEWLSLRERK